MFCKNCGNEIEENVRFCSHCGYNFQIEATTEKVINTDKENKLKVSSTLNVISLIITLCLSFLLIFMLSIPSFDEVVFIFNIDKNPFMYATIMSLILSFITSTVGIITKIKLIQSFENKNWYLIYLCLTILTTISTIIGAVSIIPFFLCLIGLMYFVPNILIIIALTKFHQATK